MLLIAAAFAGPAVIDPAAAPLVTKARAAIGDPYQTDGVRFTFVVGDTRRTHAWDVKHDRIAVSWTRDDGVTCAVTTTTGYAGDDKTQREAWEIFVNDQFWLFAPAKLADDGATVTTAGDTLTVRYDGVGVTPGDQYTYTLDPHGVVTAWTFVLGSGRSGTFAWAPPTTVGPLHLSLTRTAAARTIRFEDVSVEPVTLGPPSVDCPLKTPIAP